MGEYQLDSKQTLELISNLITKNLSRKQNCKYHPSKFKIMLVIHSIIKKSIFVTLDKLSSFKSLSMLHVNHILSVMQYRVEEQTPHSK